MSSRSLSVDISIVVPNLGFMDDRPNYFQRKFLVEITPIRTTHQADLRILKTRDGRQFIGKTEKSAIKQWMRAFQLAVQSKMPDKPYEGPLELSIYFGFPLIKSDKGKSAPMNTKPDFDNLAKAVCDSLTATHFWNDDSQVVFGKVLKFRTPSPFVGIELKPCTFIDDAFCNATRDHLKNEGV